MSAGARPPRALVLGCAGPVLGGEERRFFASCDPFGFILFARNVEAPGQVAALVRALRETVGRADAPVLIDQEGGRVARLRPPHWPARPPAARFGALAAIDRAAGAEAAALNARLIAADLAPLGIDVNCLPVLDVPAPGAHAVIGDRAFAADPDAVAVLGRAACGGLLAGGVLPALKHVPGHGRAGSDSHLALPVVNAPEAELEAVDFAPFRALRDMPLAMTAHVVYSAIDPDRPATVSPRVVARAIRGAIGFDGLLMTDDVSMAALSGAPGERAAAALAAGCDLVLHCNGDLAEMRAAAAAVGPLSDAAQERAARAAGFARTPPAFDAAAAAARLDSLLAAA